MHHLFSVTYGTISSKLFSLAEKLRIEYKTATIAFIIAVLLLSACMLLWKPGIRTKYRFIRLSAGYLLIHLMDGFITFVNTPTLARERNPLVSKLGLGWGALFTVNLICFLLIVLMAWCFNRYEYEQIPSTGMFDYYMKLFYGDNYKRSWFWYKLPKNHHAALALSCYAMYWGLTALAPVFVIGWLLIMLDCRTFRWQDMHIVLILVIPVTLTAIFIWVKKGYQLNCSDQNTTSAPEQM